MYMLRISCTVIFFFIFIFRYFIGKDMEKLIDTGGVESDKLTGNKI